MKKMFKVLVAVLVLSAGAYAENGGAGLDQGTSVTVINDITSGQSQDVSVNAQGGSSWNDNRSDAASNAEVNINTTSITDVKTRTPPLTAFPPYLPYWSHGGWGTVKGYFPNGPTTNDAVYETTFDPENPEDMYELQSVLRALPHEGLLAAAGGVLNSVASALFGAPDRYHHGRGLEISNSVVRDRRPEGKPLLVFIDSNVDMTLLRQEGYAYVGKVSIEGDVERNWDHAYKAAIAEALLWDVDILLVSGGMKGVTVGSNVTFPSAGAGYSQLNYSLSLFGAKAEGITEGRAKAVLSVEAYRFHPERAERRRIPESLYDRIRVRPVPAAAVAPVGPQAAPASVPADREGAPAAARAVAPGLAGNGPTTASPRPAKPGAGIGVSRELLEMAGFRDVREVQCMTVR